MTVRASKKLSFKTLVYIKTIQFNHKNPIQRISVFSTDDNPPTEPSIESFSYCCILILPLKTIFVFIVIVSVFGYMWYADMLPFDYQTPVALLSPTPENIQQISNVVTSNKHQIIYYSFENVPSVPNREIPINALKKAIETWETNNPNMEFIQSENPNIEIKWQVYASSTHTGLATCNSVLFGILSHCVLIISIGNNDCNDNFVQDDENMVTNILMHEIGHSLGLGHSGEIGHLMFSTKSPQLSFDTNGYVIPDRFEELYVGQKALLQQEKEIRAELDSLDVKISREQLQYAEYVKQYEHYEGKTLSTSEYQKSEKLRSKINSEADKINAIINQQNQLIEQLNKIIIQLGCKPNFEIKS